MGVYWQEKDKIVFGVLIAPDGRVICQKSEHKDFISPWRATLYKKMDCTGIANTDRVSEACMKLELSRLFKATTERISFMHLFSHHMPSVDKRLEVVLCKMGASSSIEVPPFVKIRLMSLEDLSDSIKQGDSVFCNFTREAINLVGLSGG